MKKIPQKTVTTSGGFELEALLKNTFILTKNRILSYILTIILTWLMMFAVIFVAILLGGIIVALTSSLKDTLLLTTIYIALGVAGYLIFIYITSWMQLAIINIFMGEKKGVIESIKSVHSYVWNFVGINIMLGLFLIGLFPFGLLTIFIVYILWGIWGSFTAFVYLDYKKKGLQNVWMSRALVNQNFWGIVLRFLVLYGIFFAGFFILTLAAAKGDNGTVNLLSLLFSLASGPFMIAYTYEMYKEMKSQFTPQLEKNIKTPMVWIALSIIGAILMLVGLVIGGNTLMKDLPNMMKDIDQPSNGLPIPSGMPSQTGYSM